MKENGFDLTEEVRAQKWERYFDRLVGPTFPALVKEFWIHAKISKHLVISSEKLPPSDTSQAALDRQALEELRLNDLRLQQRMEENDQKMKARMNVQDSKIDSVVTLVQKQNVTSEKIQAMLESLFSRMPPQP